eukprot:374016-Prorocentrum_minimum.AAC.3
MNEAVLFVLPAAGKSTRFCTVWSRMAACEGWPRCTSSTAKGAARLGVPLVASDNAVESSGCARGRDQQNCECTWRGCLPRTIACSKVVWRRASGDRRIVFFWGIFQGLDRFDRDVSLGTWRTYVGGGTLVWLRKRHVRIGALEGERTDATQNGLMVHLTASSSAQRSGAWCTRHCHCSPVPSQP